MAIFSSNSCVSRVPDISVYTDISTQKKERRPFIVRQNESLKNVKSGAGGCRLQAVFLRSLELIKDDVRWIRRIQGKLWQ